MNVLVASNNPVKIAATAQAFQQMFPEHEWEVSGAHAPSGVSAQPFSDEETWLGAKNRVAALQESHPNADFWVGIEGGVKRYADQIETFAWMLITSPTQTGKARSAGFFLPPRVIELLDEGLELGHANDRLFEAENSKQKGGALGLLTHGVLTRTDLYVPALMMALIPFRRADLYQSK